MRAAHRLLVAHGESIVAFETTMITNFTFLRVFYHYHYDCDSYSVYVLLRLIPSVNPKLNVKFDDSETAPLTSAISTRAIGRASV